MLFELLENGHFKSFALVCYTLYHNELVQEDWLQHYLDAAQEFPRWQDQAVRCLMLAHLLRLPQRPTRLEHLCASNALPPVAEETAEPDDVLGGGLNDSQNTQDTFRQELSQEMQSRLEGVEASPISVKRERLDPQGAAASSSQHAGAPHETKKEEPEEDDDGAPAEPEISVDTATWSVLQKRRLLPGAARSAFDFADHFNTLSNQNTQFQTQAAEPINNSHTILEQTKRFTVFVRERLHGVPDTIVRLCVEALAVFRVRIVDAFMREYYGPCKACCHQGYKKGGSPSRQEGQPRGSVRGKSFQDRGARENVRESPGHAIAKCRGRASGLQAAQEKQRSRS